MIFISHPNPSRYHQPHGGADGVFRFLIFGYGRLGDRPARLRVICREETGYVTDGRVVTRRCSLNSIKLPYIHLLSGGGIEARPTGMEVVVMKSPY